MKLSTFQAMAVDELNSLKLQKGRYPDVTSGKFIVGVHVIVFLFFLLIQQTN
jgi:hypothetical protein